MSKCKFKIGDIIKGTERSDKMYSITDLRMTKARVVRYYDKCGWDCQIEILEHLCKAYVGDKYFVNSDYFDLASPAQSWKVVIIPDGDKTTGKLYENGKVTKEVSTVKSPKDEYSMGEAIKVITERLVTKKEEPKRLYSGKVVCVDSTDNPHCYTVGKIYQFVDGVFVNDKGHRMVGNGAIYTFDDWARWTSSKFIEVVE